MKKTPIILTVTAIVLIGGGLALWKSGLIPTSSRKQSPLSPRLLRLPCPSPWRASLRKT